MAETLNILVIEDSDADFRLLERKLKQDGLPVRCRRAVSLDELADEVERGPWDIVLSDYNVPQMAFLDGLTLLQSRLPDVPVIVVSGTVGEERAVALLKLGVSDFVLKDHLVRLRPVIERSLADAAARRAIRAAEAELRLLHAAVNAAVDAVVITDRAGTIVWVNPAFTTITGFTAEEAIGRNPRDLVKSGAHPAEFFTDLWNTLLAGKVWHGEITNRRKDGRRYPEEQSITPIKDASGGISHFVAIKRDLTAEKQTQEQLFQAQKMESIGLLAGGIAHDFNNLITTINVTADLASVRLREDDRLRADFDRIREAGERAASLTRQLLAFGRRQMMTREVLCLAEVVAKMQDMLSRLIGEDIELTMALSDGQGSVLADRGQLEQVIMNLALNARDAMPTGGALTIETRDVELDETFAGTHSLVCAGPHVMLAVSDAGVGMDADTQARIFEPFFTTKEVGKGTGLGLATVYGIVKQSGGSIWVYSAPGSGTTFKIYLPRVHGVQPSPQARPTAVAMRGTETILVVEDEEVLRILTRRLLEMVGYTVLTAGSGEEALLALARHGGPVHLVLTDVVMPGITGRELAVRLETTHPGLKVLYTSGYTDDVILRKGLLDRTNNFISKPFSMKDLTRKVRQVLDA
jgi:two-component system cell cycle sensor histidine kinase/response regulator CckA